MGSEEDDTLRRRWKTNLTPAGYVEDAIREVTGVRADHVQRLLVSYSNDVYSAVAGDGELIVRVHVGAQGHFERERWALDRCAEVGALVPTILGVVERTDDGVHRSICVQTKLPGDTLEQLLSEAPANDLVEQAGRMLRLVHSVRTEGFGVIDGSGVGFAESWTGSVAWYADDSLVEKAADAGFDLLLVREAIDQLLSGIAGTDGLEPHLLHGDFASKHMLGVGSRLTGIIDFEFAGSGDGGRDLAFWRYWHPDSFEHLLRGYGVGPDEEILRLHSLETSLAYLAYYAPRGELVGILRDAAETRLPQDVA
jgi:aminoglycoside phosphotransferase (APT) family kinase protein